MKRLRQYQNETVEAVLFDWSTGLYTRGAAVLGTGAGKTVILSEIIRRYRAENHKRVLFVVHRKEILNAAALAIAERNPADSVAVVDGTVTGERRTSALKADIVCINVSTLARSLSSDKLIGTLSDIGLVVYDEAHHAIAKSNKEMLTKLGVFEDKGPFLLGLTATLFREDNSDLNEIFQVQHYVKGLTELIDEGHLVQPKHMIALVDGLDLRKIGVSRQASGDVDFNVTELDRVMDEHGAWGVVAKFIQLHALDRRVLVFTPTVASAEKVADACNALEIEAAHVSGSTSSSRRRDLFDSIQSGSLRVLVNCGVATEGTDLPAVDCIVLARPTKSKGLYRQIVGRALRRHGDKSDALIIDLVGATTCNDLATISDLDDDLDEIKEGETYTEAVKRAREYKEKEEEAIDAEFKILQELDPEAAEFFGPIVSGSFNLIEFDPYNEARNRVAKHKEEKEKQERIRKRKLPDFPGPPKLGPFIDLGNDVFFMSLYWYTLLPVYQRSYVCITHTSRGWVVFYCDSSKSFEKGRYGFVGDTWKTYDAAENACVSFAREFNQASLFWERNKLNPNAESRKKQATQPQTDFMRKMKICPEHFDQVDASEMKSPKAGAASDWLDLAMLQSDVRKQVKSVKEYHGS